MTDFWDRVTGNSSDVCSENRTYKEITYYLLNCIKVFQWKYSSFLNFCDFEMRVI